jgi:cytochrome c oxidase assembly protein subunit 15
VQESSISISGSDLWLSRFAKVAVAFAFWLILVGGHTTTSGAGMAFPDWPLSNGSLNPAGWWENVMMRLEHGHRLSAGVFGVIAGVLCAWVWRSLAAVPLSLVGAALIGMVLHRFGLPRGLVGLGGIVSSAILFALLLLRAKGRDPQPRSSGIRWLAFAAFIGVVAQALLGGLRVVLDPQGTLPTDAATATTFRILHGCFAQFELGLVVALAAMLSPRWREIPMLGRGSAGFAWFVAAALFAQLVVGATMRHLGAGLAITTFPVASASGSWLPAIHNVYTDINFTHTRIGAVLVTILIAALYVRVGMEFRSQRLLYRPVVAAGLLVIAQFLMGVGVVLTGKQAILTTLHVVNGAALFATVVLLAVRLGRRSEASTTPSASTQPILTAVTT